MPFDLYREGNFYYSTSKYAHANDGTSAPVSDLLDLMVWDATDRMALISQPLLMIVGEKADSRYMTDEAMQKATGSMDKTLFVVPDATPYPNLLCTRICGARTESACRFFQQQTLMRTNMKHLIIVALAALSTLTTMAQKAEDFKQPYPLGQQLSSSPNFTGDVWLAPVSVNDSLNLPAANVTFAPCCINSWHYHTGGQVLVASAGVGYYQEKGKPARRLFPGDIVEVAPNTLHWHGAAPDSWFAHIALKPNSDNNQTIWLESVGEEVYREAVSRSIKSASSLDKRQQAIVAIGSYTGRGDLEHLPGALVDGLEAGMTVNEIKEVLVQAYAYCGFPRSLRAIQTFMKVLDGRKTKGIADNIGREATPIEENDVKYDRGAAILETLSGINSAHPQNGYGAFAPTIDRFLKEHLFADIFERDLLSYQEREIATVSFLAGMGGVEPMAYGHMGICLHLGITHQQLSSLLDIVENNLGNKSAEPLREVLKSLTSE